jgi:hypothetical protein
MPDHATIYISDPSMLGSKYIDRFDSIISYSGISEGELATGLKIELKQGSIKINFMAPENIPKHLNGFSGYCQKYLQDDNDELIYVLSRIKNVRYVLGCVIEPEFDKENLIIDFLYEFSMGLNGLFFIFNSVYDFDGNCLLGPMKED